MSEKSKFWLGVWLLVLMMIFVITKYSTEHAIHEDKVIAELILNGMSAIEAQCAFSDSAGNNPTCIALAVKK